jgi:hypothetical protein
VKGSHTGEHTGGRAHLDCEKKIKEWIAANGIDVKTPPPDLDPECVQEWFKIMKELRKGMTKIRELGRSPRRTVGKAQREQTANRTASKSTTGRGS